MSSDSETWIRSENSLQRFDVKGESTVIFENEKFSLIGKFSIPPAKVQMFSMVGAALSITAKLESNSCVFYSGDDSNRMVFLFAVVWQRQDDPGFNTILLYFMKHEDLELLQGFPIYIFLILLYFYCF